MEIRQLRYFVEICKHKSFSKAASICFMSPQGMSMSMMRLEEELGCKLFERTSNGVSMTQHAQFLLPKAKKIIDIADECDAYFEDGNAEEAVVSFACSHGTIEEFAGKALSDFSKTYADIQIKTTEMPDMDVDEAIINEECEIGVNIGPVQDKRIESVYLMSSDYILIMRDDDPLADKTSVKLEELKGLKLAVMKNGVRTYSNLKKACESKGFEPDIHTFCDNILLVYYLATLPGVYGITTRHLFNRLNAPGIAAVTIDDTAFKWKMYKIKRKGKVLKRPAELLWKAITKKK